MSLSIYIKIMATSQHRTKKNNVLSLKHTVIWLLQTDRNCLYGFLCLPAVTRVDLLGTFGTSESDSGSASLLGTR